MRLTQNAGGQDELVIPLAVKDVHGSHEIQFPLGDMAKCLLHAEQNGFSYNGAAQANAVGGLSLPLNGQ
ncbi:hypothetical protein PtB15_7B285 [Puccinia triticina]|nr:hypothetical protein PtB15_7B285 [Puccinia triticina]